MSQFIGLLFGMVPYVTYHSDIHTSLIVRKTLEWAGRIRIDGQTYTWLGDNANPAIAATVIGRQVTPTRTMFSLQAGPMDINVTFLSPIEVSRTDALTDLHEGNTIMSFTVARGLGKAVVTVRIPYSGGSINRWPAA